MGDHGLRGDRCRHAMEASEIPDAVPVREKRVPSLVAGRDEGGESVATRGYRRTATFSCNPRLYLIEISAHLSAISAVGQAAWLSPSN
jgi:hypothetical protein